MTIDDEQHEATKMIIDLIEPATFLVENVFSSGKNFGVGRFGLRKGILAIGIAGIT